MSTVLCVPVGQQVFFNEEVVVTRPLGAFFTTVKCKNVVLQRDVEWKGIVVFTAISLRWENSLQHDRQNSETESRPDLDLQDQHRTSFSCSTGGRSLISGLVNGTPIHCFFREMGY